MMRTLTLLSLITLTLCATTEDQNSYFRKLIDLYDLQNHGPKAEQKILSYTDFVDKGSICRVKLGISMSEAVAAWGKPKSILYTGNGSYWYLKYHDCCLVFQKNRLVTISVAADNLPGSRFDNGIRFDMTRAEIIAVLGEPFHQNHSGISYKLIGRKVIDFKFRTADREFPKTQMEWQTAKLWLISINGTEWVNKVMYEDISRNPRYSLEDLIRDCQSEDPSIRHSAVRTLGDLRDRRSISTLVTMMDDEDDGIRYHAIYSIMQMADAPDEYNEAIGPLMSLLGDDNEDVSIRHVTAQALGAIRDRRAVPVLIPVLSENDDIRDDNWNVRLAAIQAFYFIRDERSVEPLMRVLADVPHRSERKSAVAALGHQADPRAIGLLIKVLPEFVHEIQDHQKKVHIQNPASWALTKMGQSAVEPLIDALQHPSREVRESIGWTLRWLTDERFGTDQAEWREWLRQMQGISKKTHSHGRSNVRQ
jgi:HEAT repeat protein